MVNLPSSCSTDQIAVPLASTSSETMVNLPSGSSADQSSVALPSTLSEIPESLADQSTTGRPLESSSPLRRITVADLSPIPKAVQTGSRKRKAQKAEVLTASPYKAQLEAMQQVKEAKKAKQSVKSQLTQKKQVPTLLLDFISILLAQLRRQHSISAYIAKKNILSLLRKTGLDVIDV